MFKPIIFSSVMGLVVASSVAYADFLPPNDLWKEDRLLRDSKVTEADFNEIIDAAEDFYGKIVESRYQAKLRVKRLWDKSTVNAMAYRSGNEWLVEMYGGLARRPEVTLDAFTLVLCHEIGHHMAGYPFVSGGGLFGGMRDWAANEGQADYFAGLACSRQLWQNDLAVNASFRASIETLPRVACDLSWDRVEDQNLCYRVMSAAQSLAKLSSASEMDQAAWDTPSMKVVKKTENGHPKAQCRLDTYAAGALCTKQFDENVIPGVDLGRKRNSREGEMEATRSSCNQFEGSTYGYRPTCWFKPLID